MRTSRFSLARCTAILLAPSKQSRGSSSSKKTKITPTIPSVATNTPNPNTPTALVESSKPTNKQSPEALFSKAMHQHYVKGNTDKAVTMYLKVLKSSSEFESTHSHFHTLLNLGQAYHASHEYHRALDYVLKAWNEIKTHKMNHAKDFRVRLLVAQLFEACDETERALEIFMNILTDMEQQADTNNKNFVFPNQIDLGFKTTDISLCEALYEYAVFLTKLGDVTSAEFHFSKALSLATDDVMKVKILGAHSLCLLEYDHDDTKAQLLIEETISLATSAKCIHVIPFPLWKKHLECLDHRGQHEEVQSTFTTLLKVSKDYFPEHHTDLCQSFADFLETKEKYQQAVEVYDDALSIDSFNAHIGALKAWCAHKAQVDVETVKRYFKEAILSLDHDVFGKYDALYVYGEYAVYLQETLSCHEEAKEMYIAGLEHPAAPQSPNYPQVAANFGVLLAILNDLEGSQKWFQEAISTNPPHFRGWCLYADHLIHKKEVAKGLEVVEQMLTIFPHEKSSLHIRLAKLYELEPTVQVDKVLTAYWAAMHTNGTMSNSSDATPSIIAEIMKITDNLQAAAEYAAILNYQLHKIPEAKTCYEILRERLPLDANIAIHYGRLLYDNSLDIPTAVCEFERVLKLDPTNTYATEFFADYYFNHRNDVDAAEDCHLQSLRTTQGSSQSMSLYANFLVNHSKNYSKAQDIYQRLLTIEPTTEHLSAYSCLLMMMAEEDPEGLSSQPQFNQQSSQSLDEEWTAMEAALKKVGKWKPVQAMLKEAIANAPQNIDLHLTYGLFLEHFVGYSEASECFQTALSLDPKNVDVLRAIASFLIRRATRENEPRYFPEVEKTFAQIFQQSNKDTKSLSLYAIYLEEIRKDKNGAERIRNYVQELITTK
eukprot:PhF_6_TR23243/c0_g1_i1/m.32594